MCCEVERKSRSSYFNVFKLFFYIGGGTKKKKKNYPPAFCVVSRRFCGLFGSDWIRTRTIASVMIAGHPQPGTTHRTRGTSCLPHLLRRPFYCNFLVLFFCFSRGDPGFMDAQIIFCRKKGWLLRAHRAAASSTGSAYSRTFFVIYPVYLLIRSKEYLFIPSKDASFSNCLVFR